MKTSWIEFAGWVLIVLELLWLLAWSSIMIWFNAEWFEGAEIYEPSHFVDVLHVIGVPALLATLFDLRDGKKTQWLFLFLFLFFTVVMIDIRGLLHSYIVLIHYLGPTSFWQAHAAISTSGLGLSILEIIWFCVVLWMEYGGKEGSKDKEYRYEINRGEFPKKNPETEPKTDIAPAASRIHYLKLK